MSTFEIKKILIPVDFSGSGEKVLAQATSMAKKTNAAITLIHVLEGHLGNNASNLFGLSLSNSEKYKEAIVDWTKQKMDEYKKKLLKNGISKVNCVVEKGSPYKKIVAVAKRINADIIIMGTHGVSGVRELVIGSNTFRVVSEAPCPVLSIQKNVNNAGFNEILLPFRDKAHSREKVEHAIVMAKMYGATIHVLGISYDSSASGIKKLNLEADQIKRIMQKQGIECTTEVVNGDYVAKFIFEHAKKKKADLIVVMSDMDKMGISEYVVGPFIQQIINHSSIPVLSIHPNINYNNLAGSGGWSFWD
ncbi:MAG: universal stress protein [Bacteroidia bacterium]